MTNTHPRCGTMAWPALAWLTCLALGGSAALAQTTLTYSYGVQLKGESVYAAWRIIGNTSSWTTSTYDCVGNGAEPPPEGGGKGTSIVCPGATAVAFEVRGLQKS